MNTVKIIKKSFALLIMMFAINAFSQKNVFDISRSGTVEELKVLYNKNPNIINAKSEQGYKPLVLACYNGNKDVVSFLIDKVDNINGVYAYGSPLMAAVIKGYPNIVNVLLDHGVNPNLTDAKGTTAGHYAVMFKNYDIIKQLIKVNTDFNIKNNVGKSAMDFAIDYNDIKLNELFKI